MEDLELEFRQKLDLLLKPYNTIVKKYSLKITFTYDVKKSIDVNKDILNDLPPQTVEIIQKLISHCEHLLNN